MATACVAFSSGAIEFLAGGVERLILTERARSPLRRQPTALGAGSEGREGGVLKFVMTFVWGFQCKPVSTATSGYAAWRIARKWFGPVRFTPKVTR